VDDASTILSPSFGAEGGGARSYELKFLVDDARARDVAAFCLARLKPDAHAQPELGGAYQVRTLYFDTPGFDVHFRCPPFRRSKLRIRRYGADGASFVEHKLRVGDRVSKRRAEVGERVVASLPGSGGDESAPWSWFARRMIDHDLRPRVLVTYERTAFVGEEAGRPFRLTLDAEIRATPESRLRLDGPAGQRILDGMRVLELKFRDGLPAAFKDLVAGLGLAPAALSKYRLAVAAFDLAPAPREAR
jgi:hypothetical protein